MNRADLAERLAAMVSTAEKDGVTAQQTIARQYAARSMLNSGNFFSAGKQSLESIYDQTLQDMARYALSVVAPSSAARALETAALDLESKFLAQFEGVLSGSASGNACPPAASKQLLDGFRNFIRERLRATVSDTKNNVDARPIRGWQGWVVRYGWNAANTLIALAALYVSWSKK